MKSTANIPIIRYIVVRLVRGVLNIGYLAGSEQRPACPDDIGLIEK